MELCIDESPIVKSVFLFDSNSREIKSWIVENNFRPQIKNNVYYGKIVQMMPHLQGCFVDIGLGQNAFFKWTQINKEGGKDAYKNGDFIFGQILKEPYQTKGAQLTSDIAVRGRFVVYLPNASGIKVSRKLSGDVSYKQVEGDLNKVLEAGGGVILRTKAKDHFFEALDELKALQKKWAQLAQISKLEKKIRCIINSNDFWLETLELMDKYSVDVVHLENQAHYDLLRSFGVKSSQLKLKSNGLPTYAQLNLNIDAFLKCDYYQHANGISIVLNELEAFTIIDINSDKYQSAKHDPVFINTCATHLIKQVLELRRITGVILIDYLTMKAEEKNVFTSTILEKEFSIKEGFKPMGFTALGIYELLKIREQPSIRDLLSYDFRKGDLAYFRLSELYFELKRLKVHTKTESVEITLSQKLFELEKAHHFYDELGLKLKIKLLPEVNYDFQIKTIDMKMEM